MGLTVIVAVAVHDTVPLPAVAAGIATEAVAVRVGSVLVYFLLLISREAMQAY
jgi:hypothetical protein